MSVTKTLLLASLFQTEMPQTQRIEKIKNYFDPPALSVLKLKTDQLHSNAKAIEIAKLRGSIIVTPPKNVCFTITKSSQQADIRVCEKKEISFSLHDINDAGEIVWDVKTGPQDLGTFVSWQTPYRKGSYVDRKMAWPGNSKDFFIASCETRETRLEGRMIYLQLFDSKKWTIRLPEHDVLSLQPKQILYSDLIQGHKPKGGLVIEERNPNVLAKILHESDYDKFELGEWVPTWKMPAKDSYEMSASGFMPNNYYIKGSKSKCRYRYEGVLPDKKSGLFECHDTADFHWVYFPISCINELKHH